MVSLTGSTTSRLVLAEHSDRRPGTSAVEVNGPRYCGASPWRTLYVSTVILNWIRFGKRSQCTDECIGDVIGAQEMEDELCRSIQS